MRFAIATLGCKVNQYDSAIIESRLAARGWKRRDFTDAADVYVINTCTVTDRADSESLKLARRARRINPDARIVMTGCFAQANPEALANAAEVDAVVGLSRLDDLDRAVAGENSARVMVTNLRKTRAAIELKAVALEGQTRAFLKLQEGCDQFCSFCIVPTSRGRSRSVEPRHIIAALDELALRGFKEATLSGVHLGGYGRDLDPAIELADLLEMIAERSPITRIRVSSLDPEELSDRIIDVIAKSPSFCAHLHLPLQSGEDGILARMRRRYDRDFFRDRVERVLSAMPDAAIGTDLIVGFPGESAAQFEATREYVSGLPLAYLHVFPYSVRAGTTAARFPGRVGAGEIKRRAAEMRRIGEQKRSAFAARFVGRRLNVLLEESAEENTQQDTNDRWLSGYSRNYIRVLTSGPGAIANHVVEVEASLAKSAQLVGQVVPAGTGISFAAGAGPSI